ncbi:MAG: FkbM family methyltransferase [Enhydrobacter sp.]|nr:MAG: FkbM family methyltransferase [Enhydrobacter sp.]
MTGLVVNLAPIMTEHLVSERRVFAAQPLVIFDVGARGGVNPEWAVFGDQLQVFCFEPDETECKRLTTNAPPQIKYLPYALGRSSGAATLYEAELPASSSLYKTRMEYFGRFVNRDNGMTVSERKITVRTLDEVAAAARISYADFIKLDTEGAELDVLVGGKNTLNSGGVLGILSEIRFHQEINQSPPFASLDELLREQGFRLYDIHANRHSRLALPYPQRAEYRLPTGERFFAYTTRGQVQDGDALYFRDLLLSSPRSPLSVLKLCSLMEIYSLGDCAAELIIANKERLRSIADPEKLLDLLASGIRGSTVSYRDYMAEYFAPQLPPGDVMSIVSKHASGNVESAAPKWAGLVQRIARRFRLR